MRYFLLQCQLSSLRKYFQMSFEDLTESVAECDGLKIPGSILGLEESTIRTIIERVGLDTHRGMIGDEACQIISAVGLAQFHSELEGGAIPDAVEKVLSGIFADYSAMLGYTFIIRVCAYARYTPRLLGDNTIEIILGASPPGSLKEVERKSVCGITIERHNYYLRTDVIAMGQGVVVYDDAGTAVAQIIGSTFYFFIPRLDKLNWMFSDSDLGTLLFRRIFTRAWNAFALKKPGPTETPLDSPDALLGFMIEAHSVLPAIYRTKLAAKEEETAAAHSKYVDLLRDQRMCREAMRMFEGRIGEIRSNPAEVTDTWRRLRDHPLIERFYVIESAIHVETKAILCEHEGGAENTGSVVIRFPLNGSFTVWGLKPTHPKGIAHPHINPHGGACFGNVETAIQSAALDGRIADGFDLVLRWLVEGYDPTLAQSKIEEWIPKGAV